MFGSGIGVRDGIGAGVEVTAGGLAAGTVGLGDRLALGTTTGAAVHPATITVTRTAAIRNMEMIVALGGNDLGAGQCPSKR